MIIVLVTAWLLLPTAVGEAAEVSCHDLLTRDQFGDRRVLLLAAAGTLFPEVGPLVDSTLGVGWRLSDPANLSREIEADSVRVGFDRLCTWFRSLPDPRRRQFGSEISEWTTSYRTVEVLVSLLDVEDLGSAVAQCPSTRSLFPRSEKEISAMGAQAGEALASGENFGLWYALASYLGSKTQHERAMIVTELMQLGTEDSTSPR